MKNKILNKLTIFIFVPGLLFSTVCYSDITKKNFTENDVDLIVQEFTAARIHQYLFSDDEVKDNATLMIFLVKQHGYGYNQFIEKFKSSKPELYKKLFVKAGT